MVSFSPLGYSPGSDESDPWVILRTVPRVHAHDGDLSFEIANPPRLSFLTVSTGVSPAPRRATSSGVNRDPRILAADLSAGLFLTATHPTASSDPCCFVLDAASSSAHRIPDPARGFVPFGVIAAPDSAGFMVVGLRCQAGNDRAQLHCFSSRTGGWVTKDVDIRRPRPRAAWTLSDVIAHDGKLWWVDTSTSTTKGLLYCDPFADQPTMSFVPLPRHVAEIEARAEATAYDRVQVADGKLRWVHVLCDLDETVDEAPVLNGAPLLYIYVVLGGDDGGYRLDFELIPHWRGSFSLCFIWESDTFQSAAMPKDEQLRLALIDPNDTDLLYFFLGDYIFGYDIFKNVVLGYARHGMAHRDVSPSSSLLAWKLPPTLAAPAARRFGRREAANAVANGVANKRIKEESSAGSRQGRGFI